MKSNEQGEYSRSGSAVIVIAWLFHLEPLYKLSTLLFSFTCPIGQSLSIR